MDDELSFFEALAQVAPTFARAEVLGLVQGVSEAGLFDVLRGGAPFNALEHLPIITPRFARELQSRHFLAENL